MPQEEIPHKRRVRYAGTHPKNYYEKYKELDPQRYPDTIEKVLQKGSTPAGMHRSIMVQEILDFLQIKPGQTGLDATLGYGGHSAKMLACLQGKGHLYGLDVDPIEIEKTKQRLAKQGFGPEILTVVRTNFFHIDEVAEKYQVQFDFVLADLGVSSMQIDDPQRGFSYKQEGPLDLRLDPTRGISAAERLAAVTQDELEGMLVENADEPYAVEIAKQIFLRRRKKQPLRSTSDLYQAVKDALSFLPEKEREEAYKKSAARTFQALRIDVNSEYEMLEGFLNKLPQVLAPGARVAVLSFHSGEDRLVKQSMKQFYKEGIYADIAKEVIRPSAKECRENSRARSTKLRWAVRA